MELHRVVGGSALVWCTGVSVEYSTVTRHASRCESLSLRFPTTIQPIPRCGKCMESSTYMRCLNVVTALCCNPLIPLGQRRVFVILSGYRQYSRLSQCGKSMESSTYMGLGVGMALACIWIRFHGSPERNGKVGIEIATDPTAKESGRGS